MKKLAVLLWIVPVCIYSAIIPVDRLPAGIDATNLPWANIVGVEGGIPDSSLMTVFTNVPSGKTTAWINGAIQSCPSNQVVQLAAETNSISGIIYLKSGVVLRGAGKTRTKLDFGTSGGIHIDNDGSGVDWEAYSYSASGYGTPPFVANWTAGFEQGSSNLTISTTTGLHVGGIVCLDQSNESWQTGGRDGCGWCGRGPDTRLQVQWSVIKSIGSGTITIWPPVLMPNWSIAKTPQVWCTKQSEIQRAGLESLTITNGSTNPWGIPGGGAGGAGGQIHMVGAVNCWIKDVQTQKGGGTYHIGTGPCVFNTIQNCDVKYSPGSANLCYGILQIKCTGMLIENCLGYSVVGPFVGGPGNVGNVLAYCYSTNNPYAGYQTKLFTGHDSHNSMWLIEGCYGNGCYADYVHGTASYWTLFRNRFTAYDRKVSNYAWAISLESKQYFFNAVGNILGSANWTTSYSGGSPGIYCFNCVEGISDSTVQSSFYRHGNYDAVNNSVIWTNVSHDLPYSLVYSNKPDWFGNRPWPPFESTNVPTSMMATNAAYGTSIPAGYRYTYGSNPPTSIMVITPQRLVITNYTSMKCVAVATTNNVVNRSDLVGFGDYPLTDHGGFYVQAVAGFEVGKAYEWRHGMAHYLSSNVPPPYDYSMPAVSDPPTNVTSFTANQTEYYLMLDSGSVPEAGSYSGNIIRENPPLITWSVNNSMTVDDWGVVSCPFSGNLAFSLTATRGQLSNTISLTATDGNPTTPPPSPVGAEKAVMNASHMTVIH